MLAALLGQTLEEGGVYTAAKMLLQFDDTDAAVGVLVCKRKETAPFSWLDGHFGYDRNS